MFAALALIEFNSYRTHTRGQDTGPAENVRAFKLTGDNLKKFQAADAKLDQLLATAERKEEDVAWLAGDNIKMVENLLRSVYATTSPPYASSLTTSQS